MSYPTTFRTYIQRTVTYALSEVNACPDILPDDVRTQAMHALNYGLDFEDSWQVVRDLLLAMAPKMEQVGIRDAQWIRFLSDGLARSQTYRDDWATIYLELNLGMLYRFLSEFSLAQRLLEDGVARARQIGDKLVTVQMLNELAWVEQLQHHYHDAVTHAKEAITLSAENDVERGMSLRVLGMIAFQKKDLKEAEELHRTALAIFQQNNDFRHSAWSLQNLAVTLRNQGRFSEAFPNLEQAADALHLIKDLYHWTTVKMNLGTTYLICKMPESALAHLQDAEYQAVLNQDLLQLANISNCLGLTYLSLKRFADAEQAFHKAISLFTKLSDDEWRLNNLDGLGMVYLDQEQYSKAQTIFEDALAELPKIEGTVSYDYLHKSLNEHLQKAKVA